MDIVGNAHLFIIFNCFLIPSIYFLFLFIFIRKCVLYFERDKEWISKFKPILTESGKDIRLKAETIALVLNQLEIMNEFET